MSIFKKLFKIILLTATFAAFSACSQKSSSENSIKVGTIAGPETQLMEVAKQVAAKDYNLDIEIVPFTDYNMPNEALSDGSIDANMFQHKPYLDAAIKAKGYKIVPVGKTFVYPMGVYSKKIHDISALPNGAVVAIPNDPSNEARSLLILQKAGLITLKDSNNPNAIIADIATNPKKLKFKEIDAAQLPRVLPDVDLAVINTNYAMIAGLLPSRDALVVEGPDSPYANLIVVRQGSENDPRVLHLVQALHSDPVKQEAKALFKDQVVAAW
jgi:D-methionine transport system substrate-binding protein